MDEFDGNFNPDCVCIVGYSLICTRYALVLSKPGYDNIIQYRNNLYFVTSPSSRIMLSMCSMST